MLVTVRTNNLIYGLIRRVRQTGVCAYPDFTYITELFIERNYRGAFGPWDH